jgi:GNAT superfamily N-acetyltransferase
MQIREMTEDDLDGVVGIIEMHDEEDADAAEAYFEVTFEDDDPDLGDRHYVSMNDDGAVIGVGGAIEDEEEGNDIWWLGWFYVHPDHRRKGVGEALLARSLEWAREQGGRKMYIDVSALSAYEDARRFYAQHGFVEEARLIDYYNPGEDCIFMARRLEPPA